MRLFPHRLRRLAALTLCLMFTGRAAGADALGFGILQPQAYDSPSGVFSLDVRPHDRWGHGSATYRLTKNGVEVWSGDKSYALREASVTDEGLAVGIAYRRVPVMPDGMPLDPQEFLHLVILNQHGKEVLHEEEERLRNNFHSTPPTPRSPYPQQLLVDPANDRVIVRSVEGDGCGGFGSPGWRIYGLSTGDLLDQFAPTQRDSAAAGGWWVVDAQLLKGTPLIAVHWFTHGPNYKPEERAGRFTLTGNDGRPVWTLRVEGEYAEIDLRSAFMGNPVKSFFRKNPALLTGEQAEQFRVRRFARNEVVTYEVDGGSDAGWTVSQLKTDPIAEPPSPTPEPEDGELQYLGPVNLAGPPESTAPFGEISRFTFDSKGNIHFNFRGHDKQYGTGAIDTDGKVIKEKPAENEAERVYSHWNDCPRLRDDRYVEVRELSNDSNEYGAFLVSLATGESEPLPGYPGGYAQSVTRSPDGGFTVVKEGLTRYDDEGSVVWQLHQDTHREMLGSLPKSVAFLTSGQLALLTGNRIMVIASSGQLLDTVELTGAFGHTEFGGRPGYLHEVVADADGGYLLTNSRNPPVVLRYDAKGEVRSRWSPRFPDGRTFSIKGVRVAPDGRLWTTDGRTFLRLTDDGVVDHSIGASEEGDVLGGVAAFTAGWDGRWYAVEKGSGEVWVFNRRGRQQFIAKPRPDDFVGSVEKPHIAVTSAGDFFVQRPGTIIYGPPDEYLRFDSSGTPREIVTFEPRLGTAPFGAGWQFQPGTGFRCGICGMQGDDRLVVVNPPDRILHEARRRPNGKWFGYVTLFAMAPDGSMAVMTKDGDATDGQYTIDLFSAEADGIRSVPLPIASGHYSGFAYDGVKAVAVGPEQALILDLASDTSTVWSLAGLEGKRSWQPFLVAGGRELMLFDVLSGELHRYKLPS